MTDLEHLQKVILIIAKYIDNLCKKNNIDYYLLGGSAIGAIRHHGFIPWDDDLDIVMDAKNYDKFISVCREQLDEETFYFQEGYKDWPMPFSKMKLRGTVFKEPSGYVNESGEEGIFVDIFKLENSPSSRFGQMWQYFCAKYLLCNCLLRRGWEQTTWVKKLMMTISMPLNNRGLRSFFKHQVEKYNNQDTDYCLFFAGRYRFDTSFYKKSVLGKPIMVPFEDTHLPVPEGYDLWLRQIFGDYMTPPPVKKQVGLHLIKVNFGKY